jgi:hypothetical protein
MVEQLVAASPASFHPLELENVGSDADAAVALEPDADVLAVERTEELVVCTEEPVEAGESAVAVELEFGPCHVLELALLPDPAFPGPGPAH